MKDFKPGRFRKNYLYYDNVSSDFFDYWAAKKGLHSNVDLRTIRKYLMRCPGDFASDSNSILEIGSGSGRVLDWLCSNYKRSKILGCEFAPKLAMNLKEKFRFKRNVSIVNSNFIKSDISGTFGAILWMWSGFLELHPSDKLLALKKVKTLLASGGHFFLDLPLEIGGNHSTLMCDTYPFLIDRDEYGELFIHMIDDNELETLVGKSGLKIIERIRYKTAPSVDNNQSIKRIVYVIASSKSDIEQTSLGIDNVASVMN